MGSIATLLYASYQVTLVIVLLNLLIAMMNSTVQRIQDKKLLYWKFERTSVWLDFINEFFIVPPPLTIIFAMVILPLHLTASGLYGLWTLYRKLSNKKEIHISMIKDNKDADKTPSRRFRCKMDPKEGTRRKAHAQLMEKLIHRYLQKEANNATLGPL